MIYRNLNPLGRCVFLSLPLESTVSSSNSVSILYTRARQNYRRVYLSFLHQRNDTRGLGRRGEVVPVSQKGIARFFSRGHTVPHGIFNYSLYSLEREENNAPDQRRMAPLGNALLCVYLVLLIASVGASLPLRWNGDRVSLYVDVPYMYICMYVCVCAFNIRGSRGRNETPER